MFIRTDHIPHQIYPIPFNTKREAETKTHTFAFMILIGCKITFVTQFAVCKS